MSSPAANLTHASFFSGVGGMDIGLERAGWQTVSFSEIEPYANAVLGHRWPGVPNLGDVTSIDAVPEATLWTGGFPCQDLSRGGKRRGIYGSRSGLAWPFLNLVEAHRPEAVILENVPGLLSSNGGRDLGRLLREMVELRYGWAYRVFDAQWFGVPQRRRRVFILALDLARHPDARSAGKVLAVGQSCRRDHAAERKSWAAAARTSGVGSDGYRGDDFHAFQSTAQFGTWQHNNERAGTLTRRDYKSANQLIVVPGGAQADAGRVGEADGVAGRVDGSPRVEPEISIWIKRRNAANTEDDETWERGDMNPTLTAVAIPRTLVTGGGVMEDPGLLPPGLDSNRFQAIGNGVVSPVAEWVGRRLADYLRGAGV